MKTIFKHFWLTIAFLLIGLQQIAAVDVILVTDNGVQIPTGLSKAEKNLSALLTEINRAQEAGEIVHTSGMGLSNFAQESLARAWYVSPFYVDDDVVKAHCWVMKNGTMLVQNIPFVMTPKDDSFGYGDYQEGVAEFDKNGTIVDFRFSSFKHSGESFDKSTGNEVTDIERIQIITKYCDRFKTAYNQKDIKTIEAFFSDDALIITGNIVYQKAPGDQNKMTAKVSFNKQTKQQYISKLKLAFARNKYIHVDFDLDYSKYMKNATGFEPPAITHSTVDANYYGVRLHQSWKSSNYSDEGFLFLLWEFPSDGSSPIIHVRTWQPDAVDLDEDLMSLGGYSL